MSSTFLVASNSVTECPPRQMRSSLLLLQSAALPSLLQPRWKLTEGCSVGETSENSHLKVCVIRVTFFSTRLEFIFQSGRQFLSWLRWQYSLKSCLTCINSEINSQMCVHWIFMCAGENDDPLPWSKYCTCGYLGRRSVCLCGEPVPGDWDSP